MEPSNICGVDFLEPLETTRSFMVDLVFVGVRKETPSENP